MKKLLILFFGVMLFCGLNQAFCQGKNTLTETTNESSFKPNIQNINKIINLKKSDLIVFLGKNYKIIGAGAEQTYDGYDYEEYGMTFIFDDFNKIAVIECSNKVSINGARAGMKFKQIKSILGETKLVNSCIQSDDLKTFLLRYYFDNCIAEFESFNKEGENSWLTISPKK